MELGKKVILANQFSEIANQFLQSGLPQLTTLGAWVGIAAFTFQIFFDFSGYSDMAIGLGRCLGFHFAEILNIHIVVPLLPIFGVNGIYR